MLHIVLREQANLDEAILILPWNKELLGYFVLVKNACSTPPLLVSCVRAIPSNNIVAQKSAHYNVAEMMKY